MDDFSREIKEIKHCKAGLHNCMKTKNYDKMLDYMARLLDYPIDVHHLSITGIGHTLNNLRKLEGDVGESATYLLRIWKKDIQDFFEAEYLPSKRKLYADEGLDKQQIDEIFRNLKQHKPNILKNKPNILRNNKPNILKKHKPNILKKQTRLNENPNGKDSLVVDKNEKEIEMKEKKDNKAALVTEEEIFLIIEKNKKTELKDERDSSNRATQVPNEKKSDSLSEYEQKFNEIKNFTFDVSPKKAQKSHLRLNLRNNATEELTIKPKQSDDLKETKVSKSEMNEATKPKEKFEEINANPKLTEKQYNGEEHSKLTSSIRAKMSELLFKVEKKIEDLQETTCDKVQVKRQSVDEKKTENVKDKPKTKDNTKKPKIRRNSKEQPIESNMTKMTEIVKNNSTSPIKAKSEIRRKSNDESPRSERVKDEVKMVKPNVKQPEKVVMRKKSIEEQKIEHYRIPKKVPPTLPNNATKIVPDLKTDSAMARKMEVMQTKRTGKKTSNGQISTLLELCVNVLEGNDKCENPEGNDQPIVVPDRLFLSRMDGLTIDLVHSYFSYFGRIVESKLSVNETGQLRRIGNLQFADPAMVKEILDASPHFINDRFVVTKPWILNMWNQKDKSSKVFMKFLPRTVSEHDIITAFSHFGKVTDLYLVFNKMTQMRRDIGFIEFEDEKTCNRCVSKGFVSLANSLVKVCKARSCPCDRERLDKPEPVCQRSTPINDKELESILKMP